MEPPYLKHFGLAREAFNVTPDPSFLYMSGSHREALAQLSYGVKARRGFIVLTGEVGTGKTTLTHALLNDLREGTQSALIFGMVTNTEDLLRYVCEDFGLTDPRSNHCGLHEYFSMLNRFLLDSYRKNENCVLIIDEAQNLTAEVLESIRLLSNFETAQDKLLQILLIGQPELAVRLNSPQLRQLKQRVALRYHLQPLGPADCRQYMKTRLETAGGDLSVFTPGAIDTVYAYARGIPRLINVLCDNGLLTAYALGRKEVDAPMIEEVAEDLNLAAGARPAAAGKRGPQTPVLAAPPRFRPGLGAAPKGDSQTAAVKNSSGDSTSDVVPRALLERMIRALTHAMGPLAPIVVQDHIAALHERVDAFPASRWQELIGRVSQEVLSAGMRARFEQEMVNAPGDRRGEI
ncbi:MAG TPA: AAA family ATPase [Candidatus Acidoferrales bacterium]|nr:AAA family ATPase [Candidatus Acidoferrales bacterium]